MNKLSDNNLALILEFVSNSPQTVASFSSTCKSFNDLLRHNETTWKRLCMLEWNMDASEKKMSARQGWYKTYVMRKWTQKRWNNSSLMKVAPFEGHTDSICNITFANTTNKGGQITRPTLFSGDETGQIIQWDLATKLASKHINSHYENRVVGLQSLGNNIIATCCSGDADGEGATVQFIDAFEDGKVYYCIRDVAKSSEDNFIGKITAFEAIGSEYVVVAGGTTTIVWKRDKSNQTVIPFKMASMLQVHSYNISCLKVIRGIRGENDEANDGEVKRHLVVTGGMDGDCCVFDAVSGEIVSMLTGHTGPISCIHTLESGLVLTGSNDCSLSIFEPESGTCLARLHGHARAVTAVHAYQRNKTITIASGSADGTIKIWKIVPDMTTTVDVNNSTQTMKDHGSKVNAIQIDTYRLVTGSSDRKANIYALVGDEYSLVHEIDSHLNGINRVAFTDQFLAIASGDGVCSLLDYSPLKDFNVAKQRSTNNDNEEEFTEPVYDNATHTYLGTPTRTWNNYKLFKDRKPIEKVLIKPELYKDTFILYNVLSEEECTHFIKETEHIQYEDLYGYHPTYRSNKRVIVRDDELANIVYERVKDYVPKRIVRQDHAWESYSVNSHWRFCRYFPGQHFSPHIDGYYEVDREHRSWFTFMIYLNGGFEGGATNFLKRSKEVVHEVVPVTGMVLVFPHELYHEGEPLRTLQKYIMRSDLMFERKEEVSTSNEGSTEQVCVKTENGEKVMVCL